MTKQSQATGGFPSVRKELHLVWLKRDLRLQDHAPLRAAIESGGPVLLLYCFEPGLLACAESDERHWRFVWQSIVDMNEELERYDTEVVLAHREILPVLESLSRHYRLSLYSYAETGLRITYDRDKAVTVWCAAEGVVWREFPANGIQRGRKDRKDWMKDWSAFMRAPLDPVDLQAAHFLHLPESLHKRIGRTELVMELDLHPDRKLARVDVVQVIAALREQGYFLQLPPEWNPALYFGD